MARTDEGEKTAKPVNDAYTGMLLISLLALLVACVFLFLDFSQYTGDPPRVEKALRYTPPAPQPEAGQPTQPEGGQPPPPGQPAQPGQPPPPGGGVPPPGQPQKKDG